MRLETHSARSAFSGSGPSAADLAMDLRPTVPASAAEVGYTKSRALFMNEDLGRRDMAAVVKRSSCRMRASGPGKEGVTSCDAFTQ
jgi:hypothetical protein